MTQCYHPERDICISAWGLRTRPSFAPGHHVNHGNRDASDIGQEGPEKIGHTWHRAG